MVMNDLILRNLVFTILQPGIVAGLLPYYILTSQANDFIPESFKVIHILGILVFLFGLFIMLTCIRSFAIEGKGTLSPVDPTKQLVTKGLYRYSRNPMYVGVLLILIGEAIFFQSAKLWRYALIVFLVFNLFIILIEEPRLRKDFGKTYQSYCKKVRRWL